MPTLSPRNKITGYRTRLLPQNAERLRRTIDFQKGYLKNKVEEDTKTSASMRGAGHASALSPAGRPSLVAKVSPRIFVKGQNDPALATDIRFMQEAIKKRIQDNKEQLAG